MSRLSEQDLDQLIRAGVIEPDTAERIRNFYVGHQAEPSNRLTLILGVLGALLAGSGLVLVVAHNWDQFSHTTKTIFSLLPILIGQGSCLYTFIKKRNIPVWREVSALLLAFGMGASMSLINQVYQIEGDLARFIFLWTLLSLPLIYIMPSQTVTLVVLVLATWHAALTGYIAVSSLFSSLLPIVLATLIPWYYNLSRKTPAPVFLHLFNWTLIICLAIALPAYSFNSHQSYSGTFLAYLCMFGFFYQLGFDEYFSSRSKLANPFRIVGFTGILIILFIWSYENAWEGLAGKKIIDFYASPEFILSIFFITLWIYQRFRLTRLKEKVLFNPIELSFLPFLMLQAPGLPNNMSMMIINLWILIISVFLIFKGIKGNHLGILNLGLMTLLILAICRFMDESIPYVWRGLIFLVSGLAFFIMNYLVIRSRRQQKTTV